MKNFEVELTWERGLGLTVVAESAEAVDEFFRKNHNEFKPDAWDEDFQVSVFARVKVPKETDGAVVDGKWVLSDEVDAVLLLDDCKTVGAVSCPKCGASAAKAERIAWRVRCPCGREWKRADIACALETLSRNLPLFSDGVP